MRCGSLFLRSRNRGPRRISCSQLAHNELDQRKSICLCFVLFFLHFFTASFPLSGRSFPLVASSSFVLLRIDCWCSLKVNQRTISFTIRAAVFPRFLRVASVRVIHDALVGRWLRVSQIRSAPRRSPSRLPVVASLAAPIASTLKPLLSRCFLLASFRSRPRHFVGVELFKLVAPVLLLFLPGQQQRNYSVQRETQRDGERKRKPPRRGEAAGP